MSKELLGELTAHAKHRPMILTLKTCICEYEHSLLEDDGIFTFVDA